MLTRIFIMVLIFAEVVQARDTELVGYETRFIPYERVENHNAAQIQPEFGRARMGFKPVKFPRRNGFMATGFSYENLHFNYRNAAALGDVARIDTVHSVQFSLFYSEKMKAPNWSFRLFLGPEMSSDFASVSLEAFKLSGGFLFQREKNNAEVGVGVFVVDNFGRTLPLPGIFYEALLAGRHRVTVRAPTNVSWFYVPNKMWEAGLAMRISGGNYRLEEVGAFQGKQLRYSVGTFGPSLKVRLKSFLALTLDGGKVFRHKYGVYDSRHELRDYDLRRSYFVAAGVSLLR